MKLKEFLNENFGNEWGIKSKAIQEMLENELISHTYNFKKGWNTAFEMVVLNGKGKAVKINAKTKSDSSIWVQNGELKKR